MPRIFFIHDVTGGTGAYRGLLKTLESDYGWVQSKDYELIDAHGLSKTLEGEVALHRKLHFPVTENVDPEDHDAVAKVKNSHHEPVVLVGYSSGAYYAYEMVKQLTDRGFPVHGLVQIDSEARVSTDSETSAKTLVGIAEYIGEKQYGLNLSMEMTQLLAELSILPVSEQAGVFFPTLLKNGVRSNETAYGRFKRFISMLQSISKQVTSYKVKPYIDKDGQEGLPVNLLVARAEHEDHTKVDDSLGWGPFIKEDDNLKESILLKGAKHLTVFDNMPKTFLTKFLQFCTVPHRSRSDSKESMNSFEKQLEVQQQQIQRLESVVDKLQRKFEKQELLEPNQSPPKDGAAGSAETKFFNTSGSRSTSAPIPIPERNSNSPEQFTTNPAKGTPKVLPNSF